VAIEPNMEAGWDVLYENEHGEVHVVPKDDLMPHELEGDGCPCGPNMEFLPTHKLVAHSSLDGRELLEPDHED
jgi:hypothetical protein